MHGSGIKFMLSFVCEYFRRPSLFQIFLPDITFAQALYISEAWIAVTAKPWERVSHRYPKQLCRKITKVYLNFLNKQINTNKMYSQQ